MIIKLNLSFHFKKYTSKINIHKLTHISHSHFPLAIRIKNEKLLKQRTNYLQLILMKTHQHIMVGQVDSHVIQKLLKINILKC